MAKRLERYLAFFHGSKTKVFNVGEYRRRAEAARGESAADAKLPTNADSAFFNPLDANATRERLNFAQAAVRDMIAFLFEGEDVSGLSPCASVGPGGVTSPRGPAAAAVGWEEKGNVDVTSLRTGLMRALDSGRVAIFDATNSTRKRRAWLREQLASLPIKLLFIESVCTDEKMVDENIRNAKVGLPEFSHLSPEDAFRDFKARIKHYESVYEPMDEEDLSWIKLINCGKRVENNNIHGVRGRTRVRACDACSPARRLPAGPHRAVPGQHAQHGAQHLPDAARAVGIQPHVQDWRRLAPLARGRGVRARAGRVRRREDLQG